MRPTKGSTYLDIDRRARQDSSIPGASADSATYNEEKRKWQAMELSKSPMQTSTRMF